MPQKLPVYATKQANYFAVRGRFYRQNDKNPFFANILVQDAVPKLKQTHSAFGDPYPKAYIFDYRITIIEGRKAHEFQISCKEVTGLGYNNVIGKMGSRWYGDIVVMRVGKKNPSDPVDMGGKDAGRVDFAVKKFLSCVKQSGLKVGGERLYFRRH